MEIAQQLMPLSHKINKFNKSGAQILDSRIKTTLNHIFRCEKVKILSLCTQRCYGRHYVIISATT